MIVVFSIIKLTEFFLDKLDEFLYIKPSKKESQNAPVAQLDRAIRLSRIGWAFDFQNEEFCARSSTGSSNPTESDRLGVRFSKRRVLRP
jgi:hypothetical protein